MAKDNLKTEKKKVAVTRDTADQLKAFSRLNGLKMRLVIDSMVDVILQNDELSKQVAELAFERGGKNEEQP
jgi:peroxiredoxin